MLLAIKLEEEADLAAMFPDLFHSVQVIHVLFEARSDLASVAIANAHHSNRGAIRAPHDIMTWVMKLKILEAEGTYQASAVLERFNATAASKGKVTGNKRFVSSSSAAVMPLWCRQDARLSWTCWGDTRLVE